jgi:hypothetical protein
MTLDDDLVKKVETASQMSVKQRALDLHERRLGLNSSQSDRKRNFWGSVSKSAVVGLCISQ